MGIIKKLVLVPITLIAALGWVLHIYSMMLAGLIARDEKRLLILTYVTEAKEFAERAAARIKAT